MMLSHFYEQCRVHAHTHTHLGELAEREYKDIAKEEKERCRYEQLVVLYIVKIHILH